MSENVGSYTVARYSKALGYDEYDYSIKQADFWKMIFEDLKTGEKSPQELYKGIISENNKDINNRLKEMIPDFLVNLVNNVNRYMNEQKKNTDISVDESISNLWSELNEDTIKGWLYKGKKPSIDGRISIYKISFAYSLEYELHQRLFGHIFHVKPFLRIPEEFCLTYCKKHGKSYADGVNMYLSYLKEKSKIKQKSKFRQTEEGTKTILGSIIDIENEKDFIVQLVELSDTLTINAETIKKKIFNFGDYEANIPENIKLPTKDAIIKSSGKGKSILSLRKIFCVLYYNNQFSMFDKDKKMCFCDFCTRLDNELNSLNLPTLDILDEFDSALLISAAWKLLGDEDILAQLLNKNMKGPIFP